MLAADLVRLWKGAMRISKTSVLLALMVTVTSFNLRTIAVAIGPVLPSIQDELGMSQTMGGLLTSLPTLCFALFGFLAGRISGLLGLHRAILVALIAALIWPARPPARPPFARAGTRRSESP